MKIKKLSITLGIILISSVALISCKDDKKEAEDMRIEAEKVEMENAKNAEEERMAMKAKEDARKEEERANSVAGIAMKNPELTTLLTAWKPTNVTTLLSEPGNYTFFAPSNHAFEKLPQKQYDLLMMPENKERLQNVLQYHIVPGKITSDKLADAIKNNKGAYIVKTIQGEELTFMMNGDQFVIKDASGKKAQVILGNQEASNGIIYIIDTVLMANK